MKTLLQYLAMTAFAIVVSAGAILPDAQPQKPVGAVMAYADMQR